MEIRISVRGLVEFLLRSGDIDNRRKVSAEDAMSEGSRIHRMIQRRMGSLDKKHKAAHPSSPKMKDATLGERIMQGIRRLMP